MNTIETILIFCFTYSSTGLLQFSNELCIWLGSGDKVLHWFFQELSYQKTSLGIGGST